MPRNDGHSPRRQHRKHGGHRMHVRGRLARRTAKIGKRRTRSGWDPATVWNDAAGRWV